MSRLKKGGSAAAIAVTLVAGFEGVRQNAYPDPATRGHPWTICYGETEGVKPGDRRSMAECRDGLAKGLDRYADGIDKCLKVPLMDGPYVASISWTWNLGIGRFCKDIAPLFNAGRRDAACSKMSTYKRAAGVVMPGLVTRRKKEHALCVSSL